LSRGKKRKKRKSGKRNVCSIAWRHPKVEKSQASGGVLVEGYGVVAADLVRALLSHHGSYERYYFLLGMPYSVKRGQGAIGAVSESRKGGDSAGG